MKTLIASVTMDGKLELIEREYKTKKEFREDLRNNGFRIRFISTPDNFDKDCEKYGEQCDRNKSIKFYKRQGMKKFNESL